MPVSPQDFELYSRMTGAPMPADAMSRMQMAPEVFKFTKDFAKKPNILEKTGNLVKNIGKGAVMALGAPLVAASEAENARMQEQLRNKADVMQSEAVSMDNPVEEKTPEPMTAAERTVEARKELAILGHKQKMKEKAFDRETAQIKMGITQQPTTAGNYGQNVVINSTAQNVIDKKMEQGSQMADSVPNIAEVLSESEESQPASLYGTNPLNVPRLMSEDVGTTASPEFISKFRKKRGLDKALKGVFKLGQQEEELVDDSTIVQSGSPLNDHPDMKDVMGGEEPNPMMGTNTSLTTNLQEQTGGGESLNKRYINQHYTDMRKMEAQERLKRKSPSERQVNLLEQRAIDNKEAIDSGFMSMSDEERANETDRLGGGLTPPSTLDKANGFLSNFPPQSMIRYGQMGSKASGIELNPSPNGDPTIGFAISDPKAKKTTKYIYPANKEVIQELSQDPDDPETSDESLGRKKFNYLLGLAGRGEKGIGERTKKEEFDTFVDTSKLEM